MQNRSFSLPCEDLELAKASDVSPGLRRVGMELRKQRTVTAGFDNNMRRNPGAKTG
jgi:hypothetical protein